MKIPAAVICFALCLAASMPMHAQDIMRFNVPFQFTAGSKVLPAGTYIVTKTLSNDNAFWTISDNHGGRGMFVTNAMYSPIVAHHTSLIFRVDGGQYSLVEFWQDAENGRSVVRPKTSRTRLAQSKPEEVEIAAVHQ